MIKVYENQFSNNPLFHFSQTEEDNKEKPKLLLNHFKNKNASSFVQSKAIKDEYNIFKSNSNYLKRSNISDYNFRNNNQIVTSKTKKKFLKRISLMPEINYSIKNNIFASNVNLKKSFRLKEKKKTNDGQILPKLNLDNVSKEMRKIIHLK